LVDFPDSVKAYTGAIPGLYVFNDFISEAEEAQMMKDLDSEQWTKMLKRRV
jgi:hypothetical protein